MTRRDRVEEWRRGAFWISTDRSKLDRAAIHEFLVGSYWAKGIPRAIVDRSIEGSLCFGLYEDGRQVGFARVITRDAHPLYRKVGFQDLAHPERIMEMTFPGIYEGSGPH